MLCLETVESRFEIIEVWNVGQEEGSHTLQEEVWGFWAPATGLQQIVRGSKYDRRKDLQGFHLRVATIKVTAFCHFYHIHTHTHNHILYKVISTVWQQL